MASSVDTAPSNRALAVNDVAGVAYSRGDSAFSSKPQNIREANQYDLMYSARDRNEVTSTANGCQLHGRGGIWQANTSHVLPSAIQP